MIERYTDKQSFDAMVKEASPNSRTWVNCLKAFCVGGAICAVGQAIQMTLLFKGATTDDAAMYTSVILILAAVILTGLGVFDRLGKFAGAGTLVPITGFANAVAAPALEFKKEGFVFGVGARIFGVAGPVIVYGALASVAVGVVYYALKTIGG